jgi:hypothetical protein
VDATIHAVSPLSTNADHAHRVRGGAAVHHSQRPQALDELARLERAFDRVEIRTWIVTPPERPNVTVTADTPPTTLGAPPDCDDRKPYAIAPLGEVPSPEPHRPPDEFTTPLIAYAGITPAGSIIDVLV